MQQVNPVSSLRSSICFSTAPFTVTWPFSFVCNRHRNNTVSSPSRAARPIGRCSSPLPQPSARHQFTLRDHGYGASASRGVPVHVPAFAGTRCANPQRDGQAELTWGITIREWNITTIRVCPVSWSSQQWCNTKSDVIQELSVPTTALLHYRRCIKNYMLRCVYASALIIDNL